MFWRDELYNRSILIICIHMIIQVYYQQQQIYTNKQNKLYYNKIKKKITHFDDDFSLGCT